MQDRAKKPKLASDLPLPSDNDALVDQRIHDEAQQWREAMEARKAASEALSAADLKIRLH